MSTPDFKHFLLRHVDGIVVIEMLSKDVQGPDLAKEFITELMTVVELDDCKPIVLNLRRTIYFGRSMGFSALFKLVKCARERQPRCGSATCTRTCASAAISWGFPWSSRLMIPRTTP